MRAGTLNRLVQLQSQSTTQDEIGQPMLTWTSVAEVWANILHKTGFESIRSDQNVSIVQASIRIRRRAGVDAGMRVLHGAVVYAIRAVVPDEVSREHVDLVCEVVNG